MCEHGIENCIYCADLPDIGTHVTSTWSPTVRGTVVGHGILDETKIESLGGNGPGYEEVMVCLVLLDVSANANFRGDGPCVRIVALRPDRLLEK
jgi:hypothetical protein